MSNPPDLLSLGEHKKGPKERPLWLPRSIGRLAAIQVLFWSSFRKKNPGEVTKLFLAWGAEGQQYTLLEEAKGALWDESHFKRVVEGVCAHREDLERALSRCLPSEWSMEKMELTTRCLLLCGAWEIVYGEGTPPSVIFNEYINLAHGLLLPRSAGFVNAVLDALSRHHSQGNPETPGAAGVCS